MFVVYYKIPQRHLNAPYQHKYKVGIVERTSIEVYGGDSVPNTSVWMVPETVSVDD